MLKFGKKKIRRQKFKAVAPDRTVWRTRSGRGSGPVLRQTAQCINQQGLTKSIKIGTNYNAVSKLLI